MRVADLAAEMGYKAPVFVGLAKAKGIPLVDPKQAIDARLAAAVRALIPHRSRLSGSPPLLEIFNRIQIESSGVTSSSKTETNTPIAPEKKPAASVTLKLLQAPVLRPESRMPDESIESHLRRSDIRLFADTSSLMHDQSLGVFRKELKPALVASGKRLFVPGGVINELEKHLKNGGRSGEGARKSKLAERALATLYEMPHLCLVDNLRQANEPIADQLFQSIFMKHRCEFSMSLITQDVALMVDILLQAKSHSVRGIKPPAVWEVRGGSLKRIALESATARLAARYQSDGAVRRT